ncbi:hypothetical protein C6502_13065 [Candidatus Poribacteria bacterium]|nr:MAG: hypothetical protein C6502_13065 [Candidatus Poribacteria bacterium]
MPKDEIFQETVTRVEQPSSHYTLLRAPNGDYLGASDDGFATFDYVDDQAIWDTDGETYRHVGTGLVVETESPRSKDGSYLRHDGKWLASDGTLSDVAALFVPGHGPAHMPSTYLKSFRENGWVCVPAIIDPDIIEELERVSFTGRWESDGEFDRSVAPMLQTSAVAKIATEPVSLWLMREYMGVQDIRLGHSPGFAILPKDDGKRNVQGWHSDFPYLWGIAGRTKDRIPVHQVDGFAMGVQRNLCVSEFRKENGATCFKLGSHALGAGPPVEWGTGNANKEPGHREARGLPYTGPDADVVEAPPGSYILYDSRTWHRAGVNRTPHKRAAMLQAVIPMYMLPFRDTSRVYKRFINGPYVEELTELEKRELEALMVSRMLSPDGPLAITVDDELTERVRSAD